MGGSPVLGGHHSKVYRELNNQPNGHDNENDDDGSGGGGEGGVRLPWG